MMENQNSEQQPNPEDRIRLGIRRWVIRGLIAKMFIAVILFLSAGRLDWFMGWVYLGIFVVFDLATGLIVGRKSPALLAERSEVQKGTKSWDQVLVRLTAVYLPMASWILAGLDFRNGWSDPMPVWVLIGAFLVTAVGYGVVVWAMASNAYFSATVRIQSERGHTVASGGPYRIVRHPGYVGAMMFTFAAPVMLGSWWALIPGALGAALYILRTDLEDRTLKGELPGYIAYTRQTRHRLLPGVW